MFFKGLKKEEKLYFMDSKMDLQVFLLNLTRMQKKDGALGFVKGAAKGLAGLVVKPVTGVIDFASKTTEGIKNQALYF